MPSHETSDYVVREVSWLGCHESGHLGRFWKLGTAWCGQLRGRGHLFESVAMSGSDFYCMMCWCHHVTRPCYKVATACLCDAWLYAKRKWKYQSRQWISGLAVRIVQTQTKAAIRRWVVQAVQDITPFPETSIYYDQSATFALIKTDPVLNVTNFSFNTFLEQSLQMGYQKPCGCIWTTLMAICSLVSASTRGPVKHLLKLGLFNNNEKWNMYE